MNGNTVTSNSNNAVAVLDGIVELKNGTIKNGGSDYHAVATTGSSTVTLDNVNIIGQNDPSMNMLAVKTYSSDTTINIKNSTMTLINCGGVEANAGGTIENTVNCAVRNIGALTLENVTVKGNASAILSTGDVIINSGTFTNSKKDGYGTWGSFSATVSTMGAHVEINGGTFNTTKAKLFVNNNFVYVDITGEI